MNDLDKLDAFLAGPALEQLEEYLNRLGPQILEHIEGCSVRGDFIRTKDVDWDAQEIVIVDTIIFRISGPQSVSTGAAPARSSRAHRRQAGARLDRAGRRRSVRH
jgi:hypothetical protein